MFRGLFKRTKEINRVVQYHEHSQAIMILTNTSREKYEPEWGIES